VLDTALVVVFVSIGRTSHAEGLDVAGVAGTVWPFLAALAWPAGSRRGRGGIRSPSGRRVSSSGP
jgi:hypothetical protein